jgi:hypothetical protein
MIWWWGLPGLSRRNKAFSSEVGTGSREENATNKKLEPNGL